MKILISTFAALSAISVFASHTATEQYADAVAYAAQTNAQVYAYNLVASSTNGIPAQIAAVTNGIPEGISSALVLASLAGTKAESAEAAAGIAVSASQVASNVAVTASADVSTERVARQNADSSMQSAISAERLERTAAETNLYDLVGQALTAVGSKQDRLTAGTNITISNNVISASSSGEATHISWANVTDKPEFKTVSWTARYSDLIGAPAPVSNETIAAWGYITDSHLSASYPTFSNAVLAVGLNIDTNAVAVLGEIASGFGGFPIQGTATTLGGLLAAICAAIVWLRNNASTKAPRSAFCGEYSNRITYIADNSFVWHENKFYICKTTTAIGGEEWNEDHWRELDLGSFAFYSDISAKANMSAFCGDFDKDHNYSVGDFVWKNDIIYQCKVAGVHNWAAENWEERKLSSLFSGANTSLTSTIDSKISAKVQNLDPDTASLADLINALKGTN